MIYTFKTPCDTCGHRSVCMNREKADRIKTDYEQKARLIAASNIVFNRDIDINVEILCDKYVYHGGK